MSLVRWFRKNNKKLMAVVVIVIMVGFIGGSYIQQLGRRRTDLQQTVAYFADNREITSQDLASARRELEVLKMLRSDEMLKKASLPQFRTPDLQAVLLGELLFSDQKTSPILSRVIKQAIRINKYRVSDKQINDIYRRSMASDIYWLLLKNEAERVGIRISNDSAGKQLAGIIPQLFNGAIYSQLISSLVNRQGIPERYILTTFGKLLAVLQYARMVCTTEDITSSQIMRTVSMENETVDVNLVRIDSAVFAETQQPPSEEKIIEHFEKYKKFFAGTVSEQNPYGFGYKLLDRVGLEYIAVKLDDVSTIVTKPTQEQTEEYYQKYREQYTELVPSDPNDPNSLPIEKSKSYAEVAGDISERLLQSKINSKAEEILQQAKTITEVGFQDIDIELDNISAEQLKQMAGDYKAAAEQLSEKYKIKVYTGQTGLLAATDIQADEYLGNLYLLGYGGALTGLAQIVFAIDQLQASELDPFDVQKPRLYENIGPMGDALGRIVVIARVVKAEKASESQSINHTFSRSTFKLEQDQQQTTDDIYSVREEVTEDLKKLAAMDTTRSKAEEFIDLAVKNGWQNAVDKFNELYGRQAAQDRDDPNVFKLQSLSNLRRISSMMLATLAVQSEGNPSAQPLIDGAKREGMFVEQLYALVPQDANTVETLPLIVEFKPNMSFYCLKDISVRRLQQQQYEKIKTMQAYREDFVQSQSLAAVHFNPENILKRMNFRLAEQDEQVPDVNVMTEPQGAS